MKTSLLQGLTGSMVTEAIMHYALPLAIVQVLGVILFAIWAFSL